MYTKFFYHLMSVMIVCICPLSQASQSDQLKYIECGKKYLDFHLYDGLPTVIFSANQDFSGNPVLVLNKNGLYRNGRQVCQWHSENGTSEERPDDSVLISMNPNPENTARNACLETGPIRSNYSHYVGPAYLMIEIMDRLSEELFIANDDGLLLYFKVKSSTKNIREITAGDES